MLGSNYHRDSTPGSPGGSKEDSEARRGKRRRLEEQSLLGTGGEAEAGPSRRRLAPRRIPSDSPSDGHQSGSGEEGERISRGSETGESTSGDTEEGSSITSASDWTYELVVVQHPQRARACGFGDKDRRPLSPPPILRLYIRTAAGVLVDPSKVAIQFLLVMVDLWSADSRQERNVVMHPGSSIRQHSPIPIPAPPPTTLPAQPVYRPDSRPATAERPTTAESRPPTSHYPAAGWGWSDQYTPRVTTGKSSGPSPHTRSSMPGLVQDHLPVPTSPNFPAPRPASSPNPRHANPPFLPHDLVISQRPYTAPSQTLRPLHTDGHTPSRGTFNLPPLASITESLPPIPPLYSPLNPLRDFARPTTASTSGSGRPSASASTPASDWTRSSYRPSSSAESSRPATDYSFGRSSTSTWYTSSFSSDGYEREHPPHVTGWPPAPRPSTSGQTSGQSWNSYSTGPSSVSDAMPLRASTSSHPWGARVLDDTKLPRPYSSGQSVPASMPFPLPAPLDPMSRPPPHTAPIPDSDGEDESDARSGSSFSRVLVGSVCAMCQRLTDEDGDEGLFFFTHDLAVRTEGVFRLKFALSNLEPLLHGTRITGDGGVVLAEAYSDTFTVYSAKKFPGVVATTKLTSLFASQNVRLPTRQKRAGGGGAGQEGEVDEEDAG